MMMKKIIFFAAFCFSFLMISCGNDDDNNDGINVGPGEDGCVASWTVDGVDFSEDNLGFCLYLDNTLNLSSSTTGGTIQLQINPITETGTYTADPSNPDILVFVTVKLDDGTTLGSDNVEIVVTELSTSGAKGTFSGTFFDIMDINQSPDYTVTNGKFEANF